ncbi:alpha-L-arabinofuranosidase C-terminal domain-containing protein [Ideonella sp. DXS29W]|uniref:non-reducing end alpha-L-arabinofuranosidase n=1 Tax=Ideonella lacteola TaxID=2984193 RepID=A0ABU9BYH0_9BURK
MKTSITRLLAGLALAGGANALLAAGAPAAAEPLAPAQVRLQVSAEAAGPVIEPTVYGHFAEHLGTGIYGGLWVGTGSTIPHTRGWRNDVIQALKRIGVPVVRWPGGCFADDYDWRDGIGPRSQRPVRLNKFWGMVPEPNEVGTHEFMDLVEQLGAEAYLAGNMGSMTPRALSQWLEYMTSDSRSSLAEERRRNGRDKPWKVKYLGIGNESWGCGGHMRPEYQADLHRQYVTWLHTPVVRVASGDGEGRDEVIDTLMARAGQDMDAITLHYYTVPGPSWEHKGSALGFTPEYWARALRGAMGIEARIEATRRIMDRHDPAGRVALYVDEWGTWHDPEPGSTPGFLQQQNSLRDALVAALTFNVFHRHTTRVKMANVAQMVNVLQALVLTDGPRMLLTPTYHAFDLYQPFKGATPLKLQLQTPRWGEIGKESGQDLPAVDASVARATDGRVWLALVNLDPQRPARVTANLAGPAEGRLLTAAAMDAHNSFSQPHALEPSRFEAPAASGGMVLELPPKSIVVVRVGEPG